MAYKLRCSQCGEIVTAANEYDAEVAWSNHECETGTTAEGLPFDLLRQVAYNEITVAQAWEIVEERELARGEL